MKALILAALLGIALMLAAIPAAQSKRSCRRAHHHAVCRTRPVRPRAIAAVGVHESEFRITLTRALVASGSVVVEMANDGEDAHDLHLRRTDSSGPEFAFPVARSGAHRAEALSLSAGRWRLWCSLAGHDAAGMHATLLVTGR